MDSEVLEKTDVEESVEIEYCHLRHVSCSSLSSLCGAFKPFTHGKRISMAGYWQHKTCDTCGKDFCPECVAADKIVCPMCGEERG